VYAKAISTMAERTIPEIKIPRTKSLWRGEACANGSNPLSTTFSVPQIVIERAGDLLFGVGHGGRREEGATWEVKYDSGNGDQAT
jgi:hypothetical protein